MKKRILAMILCVATLLSLDLYIAPLVVDAEDASPAVRITLDGSEISELALPSDEKRVLEVEVEHLTAAAYQWQVLMQGDMSLWVNIYDKIEKTCEVSEVVLREMLDETNAAFVRCVVTDAEGEKHYSSTLGVLITTPKEKEPEPAVPEQIVPEEGAAEQGASVFARRSSSFFRSAGSMARDGEPEYVTVTIKYLDFEAFRESNIESAIYSPYVATIEKGSDFTQTVVSPTFLGFAPFYDPHGTGNVDEIKTDASQVSFDYQNLETNVEIRVFYKPIEVNFAIRYFFQNVGDDLYTENVALYHTDKAETGTIIADSYIISHAGDYTGFAKMYHIPQSVAADGSTVFECYFDRLYYLMQFDLDDGYGVEPIYARYGTTFIVNDPVKHGYVFQGWDLLTADTDADGVPDKGDGVADELPNTIPNGHQHYKALWQTVNTTYTVAYWATNSEGKYEYLGSKLVSAQSGSYATPPTDDLKTSPVCGEVEHTHNAGCCSIEPHVHSDACCTLNEHVHGGAGCTCTVDEHTHSGACCTITPHTHVLRCYTNDTLTVASTQTGNTKTAFDRLKELEPNPTNGMIYRSRRNQSSTRNYNFFYIDDTWYYLGTGNDNIAYSNIGRVTNISEPTYYTVTSGQARTTCNQTAHTHGDGSCTCATAVHTHGDGSCTCPTTPHTHGDGSCTCTKVVHDHTSGCDYSSCTITTTHTHSAACYNTNPYLEFDAAKTGTDSVLVEGDGSTVVNVYYKYKTYTLRFYYAREKDGVYQVVGGTTWPFGYYKNNDQYRNPNDKNTTVGDALGKVTEWGNVAEKPEVAEAKQNRYTIDTIEYGDYTYFYLEFTAQYGANLSQLWPVDIFEPVPISGTHTQTSLKYAYFSAWNGEYKVKYTQDQCVKNPNNPNQTIKGLHLYLDADVLYSPVDRIAGGGAIEDGDLISFLGFWDNGANISWSVPMKYTYRLVCDDKTSGVFDTPIYSDFVVYDDSGYDGQTQIEIPGYTFVGRDDKTFGNMDANEDPGIKEMMETRMVTFRYTRRDDIGLTYYNYGGVELADVHATFGHVLSEYYPNYTSPPYPGVLEQNAYLFEGWYTTPECLPVSRVDVTTETVPHYDMALYAKWVPTTHKVNFFDTLDKMNAYEADPTSVEPYKTFDDVVHGNIVGSVENPVRTGDGGIGLVFGGWFYIDAGQKRAFSPLAIPINRDINVFADWSSHSPQPYRINYVLMNNPNVPVADPSTGFAYAGSTRTFQAKAGAPYNQLFDAYNEGYFPTIASHSITLQYEEDKEHPVHNVHTFYYVQASNIEYTVRYVNKVTGEEMDPPETFTTSQAVVTERFRAYPNMVPDAFYKRLVISVEKDEVTGEYVGTEDNEIIFYYMPNDTSAYYAVHFMQEKLHDPSRTPEEIADLRNDYAIDGSGGYEATATHLEGTGTIGDIESIIPQSFPGFELITDHAVTVTGPGGAQVIAPYKTDHFELTVTAEGTELYIFYRRMEFKYEVHYYKYNTTEPVDPVTAPSETTHRGFYNATVSADAKVIGGYTCVSATRQEILIRPDEAQNVIVFYYAPVQYVVEYILVPDDGGWLSNTIEVKTGAEDFEGSIPNVNEFYDFGGWFIDAACTISATSKATYDSATHKLVPIKSALSETESNKFYAKLIPRSGNLTIKRTDAADETQVFVYEIRNNATGDVIEVTVVGNGSVTVHNLLFGEYTVTQQNGWSWRYGDLASAVTHSDTGGTTVQFVTPQVRDQWLSDNSDLILNRKGDTA